MSLALAAMRKKTPASAQSSQMAEGRPSISTTQSATGSQKPGQPKTAVLAQLTGSEKFKHYAPEGLHQAIQLADTGIQMAKHLLRGLMKNKARAHGPSSAESRPGPSSGQATVPRPAVNTPRRPAPANPQSISTVRPASVNSQSSPSKASLPPRAPERRTGTPVRPQSLETTIKPSASPSLAKTLAKPGAASPTPTRTAETTPTAQPAPSENLIGALGWDKANPKSIFLGNKFFAATVDSAQDLKTPLERSLAFGLVRQKLDRLEHYIGTKLAPETKTSTEHKAKEAGASGEGIQEMKDLVDQGVAGARAEIGKHRQQLNAHITRNLTKALGLPENASESQISLACKDKLDAFDLKRDGGNRAAMEAHQDLNLMINDYQSIDPKRPMPGVPQHVSPEMRVSLNPLPPLPQGASPSALKDHAAQLVSLRPDTMGTIFLAPGEYKGSVDHADIVARNRSEAIRELRHEMKSNQHHIGTERVAQAQAAAVKAAEQAGHPKEVVQALKDLVAEGAQQAQAQIQAQIDELDGRVRSRLAYVMGLGEKATDTEIERQIQDLYAGLPTTQEGLEAREREGLHAAAKFFEEHPDHIGVDHFVKGLGLEPGASKAEIAKAIDQADVSESARQSSLDDARRMEHMNELIGDYRAINPHAVR